jgi:hypothetical protein
VNGLVSLYEYNNTSYPTILWPLAAQVDTCLLNELFDMHQLLLVDARTVMAVVVRSVDQFSRCVGTNILQ